MPSSLRLGALMFATAGALKASKKPAIANLLESATNMLKNGATPAVVDFAEETLGEVSGVVIPAIINESENDQRFIHALHSRFQDILDKLSSDNQEVFQLNAEEQAASATHKGCRDMEAGECTGKRECEMELYRRWTIWVTEEEELREIHAQIDGHFCPPGSNGTLHAFRVAAVGPMQAYMAQKIVVDEAEAQYDIKVPECVTEHGELDRQSATCNAAQTDLEEKACSHGLKINEVLTAYYNDHAQASAQYNCAVEEIMELERDRKREWITLQVVNCLLERIREQNGVPCDESTGTVTDEVAHCEELHSLQVCDASEGEPKLCLDYPPIPNHPPNCAARDQVIGECLPVVQPLPCNPDYIAQEYAGLPAVPEAPFSHTNPGCNAYPECVGCPEIVAPHPIIIDSCPGYTVDGCSTNNNEEGEHPLTFVRSVDGTADVRCCDDSGSCQSQNLPTGIEFITPNGGVHDGCVAGVTYQEAMSVCHAAGKRICNTDEMDSCCGTGCWHNHHAVWVDVASQTSLD